MEMQVCCTSSETGFLRHLPTIVNRITAMLLASSRCPLIEKHFHLGGKASFSFRPLSLLFIN